MNVLNPHRALRRITLAALGLIMLATIATGQTLQWSTPAQDSPLPAEQAFTVQHEIRADGGLSLTWKVTPGYYLYQDQLKVSNASGPIALDLPAAEQTDDAIFGLTAIYRHDLTLHLPAQQGVLNVQWQGCQDGGICYAPQSTDIALGPAGPDATTLTLAADTGLMDRLGAKGVPVLLLAFFGFGLALAFTPCVLPMVPILGGYLARGGAGMTRMRGLTLSTAYVVAMASAFGLLGMAAAATGQNLQILLQSPIALSMIIGIFLTLALSMFGLFTISLPGRWAAALQGRSTGARGTVPGALGLGFSSALVVGPCVTAPLAAALLYISQTGDVVLGSAALFVLGLGKGAPLIVFGTLGSKYLPRSGPWMVWVKQGFGFVFLGLALWLVARIAPGPWIVAGWGLLLAGFATFMLRAILPNLQSHAGRIATRVLAAGVIVPATVLGLAAAFGADDPLHPFAPPRPTATSAQEWHVVISSDSLNTALTAADQPVVIYLTADWCVSCRTIERQVLPDAEVVAAFSGMHRIKVDLSDFNADSQTLMRDLGVAGPPTMIFLDDTLAEVEGTRLIGETRAAPVISSARRAHR